MRKVPETTNKGSWSHPIHPLGRQATHHRDARQALTAPGPMRSQTKLLINVNGGKKNCESHTTTQQVRINADLIATTWMHLSSAIEQTVRHKEYLVYNSPLKNVQHCQQEPRPLRVRSESPL